MKFSFVPFLMSATIMLSGCAGTHIADDAFAPKGHPEALLSASSEKVNFAIEGESSLDALADWIHADVPTRAELACEDGDNACASVRTALSSKNIPVEMIPAQARSNIVLVYERVVARPCNTQFISNHQNPYNLNHPSFGCATAMNAVQMVGDYRQFTSPAVSDAQDAELAVKNMRRYQGINDPYYPY